MKMIVSDYDDTFYINDSDIINNVKLTNEFVKNNIFVIATGRSHLDFKKKQDLYNISCTYLIINHGATILKDDEVIYNKTIDNEIKDNIIKELELDKTISIFGCQQKDSRVNLQAKNLNKIHVRYKNVDDAIRINDIISSKYSNYVKSFLVCNKESIEIISVDVDKSNAIKYIANLESIKNNNIYTIGDSYNDIEMIKDFNGYAIANSVDELKKVAIKEYKSVSELISEVIGGSNEEFK